MIRSCASRASRGLERRVAAAVLAAAAGACVAPAAFAQVPRPIAWDLGVNGNWNDPTRWNPMEVPNSNAMFDYEVTIGVAGTYAVDLNFSPTISTLTLTAPNATFRLDNNLNTMNVVGAYQQTGTMVMGPAGRNLDFTIGGPATFRGCTVMHGGRMAIGGTIVFDTDPTVDPDMCDTNVDPAGDINLNGNGNVLLGMGSRVGLRAGQTWTIANDGGIRQDAMANNTERLDIAGRMVKTGGAGNTQILGVQLNNTGTVEVATGTLTANKTLSGTTLPAGGAWIVRDNTTLDFTGGQNFLTNQATITLEGTNATFAQLGGITANGAGAAVNITNGKAQTFTNALANAGALTASGASSSITASGTLTNAAGGMIQATGTNTTITHAAALNNAGALTLNASGARLNSNGALTNTGTATVGGGNAQIVVGASGSLTNAAAGTLTVQAGAGNMVQSAGNVTNDGMLRLGAGTSLQVTGAGQLTNYNGGTRTLGGGTYDLGAGAQVQFPGTTIRTLNSKVMLADSAAKLTSNGTDDILRGPIVMGANQSELTLIGATGELQLNGSGDNFRSNAATNFTVAPGGKLTVGAGASFTVPPGNDLTNFLGGVFRDGAFNILGTITADNLAINTIDNELTLDGAGSQFLQTGGADALAPLNTIASNGNFTIANGRSVTTTGTLTVDSGGTLNLRAGSLTTGGTLTINGNLRGTGTINGSPVVNGTFAPGNSPGICTVMGDLTLAGMGATRSEVRIEIGGLDAGTGYDQINVMGRLVFDGMAGSMMDVTVIDGFHPEVGQFFDVILHAMNERVGLFAEFRGLQIDPWRYFVPEYLSDRIRLEVVPTPGVLGVGILGITLGMRRRREIV